MQREQKDKTVPFFLLTLILLHSFYTYHGEWEYVVLDSHNPESAAPAIVHNISTTVPWETGDVSLVPIFLQQKEACRTILMLRQNSLEFELYTC